MISLKDIPRQKAIGCWSEYSIFQIRERLFLGIDFYPIQEGILDLDSGRLIPGIELHNFKERYHIREESTQLVKQYLKEIAQARLEQARTPFEMILAERLIRDYDYPQRAFPRAEEIDFSGRRALTTEGKSGIYLVLGNQKTAIVRLSSDEEARELFDGDRVIEELPRRNITRAFVCDWSYEDLKQKGNLGYDLVEIPRNIWQLNRDLWSQVLENP